MEKTRVRVIIVGIVQGVFFRHSTREMALNLGITGWVKNRRDGSVEALFEGEKEKVDRIVQWCHRGPSGAKVKTVKISEEDFKGEFDDFMITY